MVITRRNLMMWNNKDIYDDEIIMAIISLVTIVIEVFEETMGRDTRNHHNREYYEKIRQDEYCHVYNDFSL